MLAMIAVAVASLESSLIYSWRSRRACIRESGTLMMAEKDMQYMHSLYYLKNRLWVRCPRWKERLAVGTVVFTARFPRTAQ
jgi:hypothetical protein